MADVSDEKLDRMITVLEEISDKLSELDETLNDVVSRLNDVKDDLSEGGEINRSLMAIGGLLTSIDDALT
jgi:hypothetical protein